jgi:hypothetical protein
MTSEDMNRRLAHRTQGRGLRQDGDFMTGLRSYVFDDVKPTFIHSRGPWSAGQRRAVGSEDESGLQPDLPLPASGLPNGDWVRKDAVPDGEKLKRLRGYAMSAMLAVEHEQATAPRRECGGPALRPGQTVTGQS